MEFIVRVESRLAGKVLETTEVAQIDRKAAGIGPEELGLSLADGKYMLRQIQANVVAPSRSRIFERASYEPCSVPSVFAAVAMSAAHVGEANL